MAIHEVDFGDLCFKVFLMDNCQLTYNNFIVIHVSLHAFSHFDKQFLISEQIFSLKKVIIIIIILI